MGRRAFRGRPGETRQIRHRAGEVKASSALFFSAYLGVLGDRHFPGSDSAQSQCTYASMKKLIAEDAEVAEVRRERKKT
jgi:hypothetical protein